MCMADFKVTLDISSLTQFLENFQKELTKDLEYDKIRKGALQQKKFVPLNNLQRSFITIDTTDLAKILKLECDKSLYEEAVRGTFYKNINECGLTTYIRGGKISGLTFNNKKFRINRLGFTEERIEELNKTFNRNKDLSNTRKKLKATSF